MKNSRETTTQKVDDAVGVPSIEKKEWFVAIVNNRSEKKYAQVLQNEGYDVFVPIQSEERIWRNGTVKVIDRVLIAAMIFVYCTENEQRMIVNMAFMKHFMVDQCQKNKDGKYPIAKISEEQKDTFRKLLEKADTPITIGVLPLHIDDKVKVVISRLTGIG